MAWTNSKIFSAFITDAMNRTTSHLFDVDTDVIKVALYGTTPTPDQTVANTLSGYNAATSQWVAANELTATGWAAGGNTLAGVSSAFTTNTYKFTGSNLSGGATDTITAAFGCLVYDNTIATKDGLSYNYFGGSQSVTSGTFTIAWNASGIFNLVL